MITLGKASPNIDLQLSSDLVGEVSEHYLEQVSQAIDQEDMIHVSAGDLMTSYAATIAIDRISSDESIAGFIRQVQRNKISTSLGELCIVELGTLWVNPKYRGQGISRALVNESTLAMRTVGFVPIASCNIEGQRSFESVGYTPIGSMPGSNGETRTVELYEDLNDWVVRKEWQLGLRDEVIEGIVSLPRFSKMTAL